MEKEKNKKKNKTNLNNKKEKKKIIRKTRLVAWGFSKIKECNKTR